MRLLEHLWVLAVDLVRAAIARRPHQVFVPAPLAATRGDLHAGLVQPDRTTCGSACLVVARMLGDRDYARWLETGEAAGRTRDPRPRRRRFADEVLATHVRTNRWYGASGALQVAWPRSLGTAPWALAHELTVTGGTSTPGTRHRVLPSRRGTAVRRTTTWCAPSGWATPCRSTSAPGRCRATSSWSSAGTTRADGVRPRERRSGDDHARRLRPRRPARRGLVGAVVRGPAGRTYGTLTA